MAEENGYTSLRFARLHTLQHVGIETESLTEEVYLQQATIFREKLQSGVPTNGIAEHLARDEDARATYNGYTSILADDLANTDKANEEEVTAKKMIARGRVYISFDVPPIFASANIIYSFRLLLQPSNERSPNPYGSPSIRARGETSFLLHFSQLEDSLRRHGTQHSSSIWTVLFTPPIEEPWKLR